MADVTFTSDRVRILQTDVLSADWAVLKKTTFEFRRSDGSWQTLTRETYDRGNGAVILPYNVERGTVLLTRQFRFPAYVSGYQHLLIEACAGLLDSRDPITAIRAETEEETGYRLDDLHKIFEAFMSPGSVTEKLHFFIAKYDASLRVNSGGGQKAEGEDIGVIELAFEDALHKIDTGEILDSKTIMLLHYMRVKQYL